METFWQTIAAYNEATWLYQIIIVIAGVMLCIMLKRKPIGQLKTLMKIFMSVINLWIAVVYYLLFCQDREYHVIFAVFWGILALLWIYDISANKIVLKTTSRHIISGNILMFMPIVYPLCSMVLGRSFPMMTSPLMPCSVAVFTAGVMLSFSSAGSLVIAMFLCHWALIGLSKIYFFNIPEDFILACSILPALCLFFNEYIKSGSRDTKPSPRTLKWFIGILCFIIGIFFCYVMAYQINLMER